MIYELRTYTVKPGTIGDMVKAASTVSREIRKDDFGKLEGYWSTEIGPLNQVMHMWSYRDFDERARCAPELAKNPRWTGEYLPLIRPLVVRQDVRLLNAIRAPVAPGITGNIYELRNYRAKPGGAVKQWLDVFTAALPPARNIPKSSGCGRPRRDNPRNLPHLGLSQPERARRSPRQRLKDPGVAGISGQGRAADRESIRPSCCRRRTRP